MAESALTSNASTLGSLVDLLSKFQKQQSTTVQSGGTETKQTVLSQEAMDAMLKSLMEGTGGLADVSSGQRARGLYNSSTNSLLTNDLLARLSAQVAEKGAPTTVTRTPVTTTRTDAAKVNTNNDSAKLLALLGILKNKNVQETGKSGWDMISSALGGMGGGGGLDLNAFSSSGSSGADSLIASLTGDTVAPVSQAPDYVSLLSQLTGGGTQVVSSSAPATTGADTGVVDQIKSFSGGSEAVGTSATSTAPAYTGTTEELAADGLGGVSTADAVATGATTEVGTQALATTGTTYTGTASELAADGLGGVDMGQNSSSSSSGSSYLAAATGAVVGYEVGKKNYETDSAMTSGEDGFGRYHHDARAEVGGAIGGGYLGWEGGSIGSMVAAPLVE